MSVTGSDLTIANLNPIRYRGYYYDTETGLYFCTSRYYDAVVCRFISADDVDVITASPNLLTDKNLFAYCDNNPIMREDNGGEFWGTLKSLGKKLVEAAIVTAAVAASVAAIGGAVVATVYSGGSAAGTVVLAVQFSQAVIVAASAGVVAGTVAIGVAEIGENIDYANAGDGISEHKNGNNWDKHSKKRPGDAEKGDARRKSRINIKKRNLNKRPSTSPNRRRR